jgi:hypothetical protein
MFSVLFLSSFTGVWLPEEMVDRMVSKRVVVTERKVLVSLALRSGDPLGSKAEGTMKHLSDPKLVIAHKKTGLVRAGGRQALQKVGGEVKLEPVGTEVHVTPVIRLDGKIQLDGVVTESQVNWGRGVQTREGHTPGIDSKSVTFSKVLAPGERTKVRVSSRSDADQTWIELEAVVQEWNGAVVAEAVKSASAK